MSAHELLQAARAAGIQLWLSGDRIRYAGPDEEVVPLLSELREQASSLRRLLDAEAREARLQRSEALNRERRHEAYCHQGRRVEWWRAGHDRPICQLCHPRPGAVAVEAAS